MLSVKRLCKNRANQGDSGELHAAIRVFCRQDRFDLIQNVFKTEALNNKEIIKAVSEALKHELPENWQDKIVDFFMVDKF